jgi:hypothetical protein
MQIALVLHVEDDTDVDPDSTTGLTETAHDRLVDGLADAGFGIVTGPDRVPE